MTPTVETSVAVAIPLMTKKRMANGKVRPGTAIAKVRAINATGAASGRALVAAGDVERDVGDHPAEPGADHDGLGGTGAVDRGPVYRRPLACVCCRARARFGRVVALAQFGCRRGLPVVAF